MVCAARCRATPLRLLIAARASCCVGTFFDMTVGFFTIMIFEALVCLTINLIGGGRRLAAAATTAFEANCPDP